MTKANRIQILPVVLLLTLLAVGALLLAAKPVLAAEPSASAAAPLTTEEREALEKEKREQDYREIAAQLEAVARADGRQIAGDMLFDALSRIRALTQETGDDPEPERSAAATEDKRDNTPGVVVHSSTTAEGGWSLSGLLPFLAVVLLAVGGMLVVAARHHRHLRRSGRPLRDLTLKK